MTAAPSFCETEICVSRRHPAYFGVCMQTWDQSQVHECRVKTSTLVMSNGDTFTGELSSDLPASHLSLQLPTDM